MFFSNEICLFDSVALRIKWRNVALYFFAPVRQSLLSMGACTIPLCYMNEIILTIAVCINNFQESVNQIVFTKNRFANFFSGFFIFEII